MMRKLRTILFPFDGSEKCRQMAPTVRDWCLRYECNLLVLNVISPPVALFLDVPPVAWVDDLETMRAESKTKMMETLASFFHDVPVTYEVETGNAAETILKYCHDRGIDLVAMPTHGYGRFRKLLLGSVTSKVLHDAKCMVLTSAHTETLHETFTCTSVLCAIDLTEEAVTLVKEAYGVATVWGAELSVVHVVPQTESRPEMYLEPDYVYQLVQSARGRVAEILDRAGVQANICVSAGAVGRNVCDAAIAHRAELLVAGRGHLTATLGRLRTHVHEIIRHSPAPVLTV